MPGSSRPGRLIAVAAAGLAAAIFGVTAAAPAPAATGADAAGAAMIRGGHFSPDTPGVDVYLTAFDGHTTRLWLSGVGYGDVSGYERIRPGLYAVAMRPHGAAASTPAALTWTLDARPGAAYTACAVGMNAQLRGIVLHDDLSMTQPDTARVRVIQAASRAARADIVATPSQGLGTSVAFATSTRYSAVPAGSYTVRASAVGDPSVQASTRINLASNTVHSVVVLDAKGGGITIRALHDATGPATPPSGAVPAGAGGAAAGPSDGGGGGIWALVCGFVALAAVAVAAGARRRYRAVGTR